MNWHDLMADGFNRVPEFLKNVLRDLSQKDLDWMPRKDSNSIGWLIWHLTRQQDAQIASLMGEEQIWQKDNWHAKFNRDANPRDIGFGHTPDQIAAFQSPDISTLLEYLRTTTNRTIQFLESLSEEDLDRELDESQYQPIPTVGVRLISILDDSVLHAGQAASVRGMIQGKGWQKY
jgi:uncharacterized damage-inducible protein DinB